jgi:hypothetical protein
MSKLLNSDFTSLIENYDILVFQETKTDEFSYYCQKITVLELPLLALKSPNKLICSPFFTRLIISFSISENENLLKANIPLDRKSLCTGKQVTVENINSAVAC